MAYTKSYANWQDSPSAATPITAAALNNIESGIAAAARSYTGTVGAGTSVSIPHNLNTRDVITTVYNVTTYEVVDCDVTNTGVNNVTLGFATDPGAGTYKVVVIAA